MSNTAIWRDRAILATAWIIIFLFVLGMWAFSPSVNADESNSPIEPTVGLVLAVFIVPMVLIALTRGARGRSKLTIFLGYFQSRTVLAVLLIGLAFGEIYYIFADVETFSAGSLAMLMISLAILIHLFAGRSSIEVKTVVLLVVWFASIVVARQSLSEILTVGTFWAASWRYRAFVLGLAAITVLLALLPTVNLSRRFSARVKVWLERVSPYSGWLLLLALGFSLLILIFNQLTDFEHLQPVLIGRISIIFVAVLASISALRRGSSLEQTTTSGLPELGRLAYIGGLAAVALGFLFASSRLSYGGISPDGLSYFNIARSYAEGNPVVRGYWSPLVSWIMALPISAGLNPVAVYVALIQITTLVWILITVFVARRWGLSRLARVALAVLVSLISLTYGFALISPDLLGAAVFGLSFYLLTNPRLAARPVLNGVILGFVIALSYYAKYYNLAFFIALIPALILLLIIRGENVANSLKVALATVFTAALLIAPWIIGIWSRYGEVTLTTSSAISWAVVGPSYQDHPCWVNQLCDEPADVLFPGEDPQIQYYPDAGWSPLDSISSLRHQIRLLWNNALNWLEPAPIGPHLVAPVLLVALVLLPLVSWNDMRIRSNAAIGLAVFSLYTAGYLFTYSSDLFTSDLRYFFPVIPIAWLAFYALIERSLPAALPHSLPRWVYLLSMAVILAIPILSFSWFADLRGRIQAEANTCLEDSAKAMTKYLVPPIAGTDESIHYISYYTRNPTRGAAPATTPASSFDSQLRTMGVRTLVTPAETRLVEELVANLNYLSVQQVEVCGGIYDVLRVP